MSEVAHGMGLDKRIGRAFLNAGIGYGGSCFPKDVQALVHLARESGYDSKILNATEDVNAFQIEAFAGKIVKKLKNLRGKTIGVLGLAFKPETDDLREAPSLKIISYLLKKGARIKAYDPAAEANAKKIVPKVQFCSGVYDVVDKADALIIVTEWPEFRELDLEEVRRRMKKPVIFDGRNIYDPKRMKELGIIYTGVGR